MIVILAIGKIHWNTLNNLSVTCNFLTSEQFDKEILA